MQRNPVGWFEIYVDDIERAKKFYEAVFQFKLEKLESPNLEMFTFPMEMNRPGAAGAICKMDGFSAGANSVIVYFSAADCAVEAGRVKEAGGRIEKEKFSIAPHGFIALAYDTEGNMFGIHSME